MKIKLDNGEIGYYYVFLTAKDFWKKAKYWKKKGLLWVEENHPDYDPTVKDTQMPCVLAVSNGTMMWGDTNFHTKKYFSDPRFVALYNQQLRKKKLKRILKK
jgi:hypothetical protein